MTLEMETRLKILEDNKLISSDVAGSCRKVASLLEKRIIPLNNEKFEMFMTHLAMAMQRIVDKKEENPIGEEVLNAVKSEPVYPEAVKLAEQVGSLFPEKITETEQGFLEVHLCNLLM